MTLADGQEVLVVDGDEKVQKGMFTLLASANLVPTCLGDPERARELIKEKFFACAVVNLDTPTPGGGIELIKYIRRVAPAARVFVMTARKVYEAAVEALRAGAADIVVKSPDQVEHLTKRIVEAAGEARARAEDSDLMTEVLGLHEDFLKRLMETSRRASELEERLGGGAQSSEADGESSVLVIEPPEDTWLSAELRKSLAAVGGYNLHVSTSGGEGIDMVSRQRFQIALVCDTLPDLPGSMVVAALKGQSPETIAILYSKPGRTRPGKAEVLEGSRVIQFVPELGEASQMLERIGELRQAFVAKSRERRYLASFREQNYELLRRYAELKQRIARATWSETMFAAFYVNGHLVTIAFSLAMMAAFAISALRVPGQRGDWWMVLGFLVTTSLGVAEMALCLRPSLALARVHLLCGGVLLFIVAVGIFLRYGSDLTDDRLRRRSVWLITAYGALTVSICVMVALGTLERPAHTRVVGAWGLQVTMAWYTPTGFALQYLYTLVQPFILVPILLAQGERRSERLMLIPAIVMVPIVGLYEDLICLGVNPWFPLSGYYATAAGLTGAFVLVERFRQAQAGQMLGDYRLGKRLGGGGMADVYEAHRTGEERLLHLERRVALKRMRPEMAADPQFVQMFLDEARLASRLSHPHIVAVHDVGRVRGELYIAMELVEGCSLGRMLSLARARGEVCDPDVAIMLGAELCDGLAYAHSITDENGRPLEVIHRDVSPQNILLTRSGHLKLADFGIAKSIDRQVQTATGDLKGKASYMAPEQIRGQRYDQRVDVFAAGVVLFEIATGSKPFDISSEEHVHERLTTNVGVQTRLRTLPEPLRELILKMLSVKPDDRPQTAADAYRALAAMQVHDARDKVVRLVSDTLAAIEREQAADENTVAARKTA